MNPTLLIVVLATLIIIASASLRRRVDFRYEAKKRTERAWLWTAHRIPRGLRCAVLADCGAYATTGQYSNTVVPDLTYMDAWKRQGARA